MPEGFCQPTYSSQYLNRRLIGLPTERILYDGSNAIQSKVQYSYDEAGYLQAHATQPIRHDSTSNGTAGNYGTNFSYRGNVTSVRRYDINNLSQYVENKTGYYITGNPAYTKNPRDLQNNPQTQTTFSYSGTYLTDGGYTETRPNTYAYLGSVTDPDGFTSSIEYHFDRGDVRRTTDPKGALVRRDYDQGRLWKVTNETNGAFTRYYYDPNHNYVQSYTTILDSSISNSNDQFYSITTFDGHGRTRAVASDHPGSTTNFKGQYTGYDNMGRVSQQSNPAEMNGSTWNPAGADVAGWAWTYQFYDWQGRPTITRLPDHDPNNPVPANRKWRERELSYEGCGCAGGQTVTSYDEGQVDDANPLLRQRRKQTVRYDVLGRPIKTETFNWGGSVYSTTVNTYNVRDQLTCVKEYKESKDLTDPNCQTADCQKTTLDYDGHGRLSQRKRPIESAATTYSYFVDDTVQTMTDARGASATYEYNNRQLLKKITYGGIATPTVEFGYDAAGNRDWMKDGTEPSGQYAVDYVYDTLSRLQSETRRFSNFSSNTYQLVYNYNLAGGLKDMTYNQNGLFDSSVSYAYDKAGQLLNVTGSGFGSVTQFTSTTYPIKYRAWGAVQQMNYGNGLQAAHTYNARLQLARRTFTTVNYGATDNDYAYYPDGRLKSKLLSTFNLFDRSYSYDHVGRLTQARTANEARGLTGTGPYRQDYVYDVWNNLGRTNNEMVTV
jgi:YD repeat-containing protein